MSMQVKTTTVCDIPDDYGEHPGRHTIRLSLNGEGYEGDFCDGHAAGVKHAFAPFIQAGRPVRRALPKRPRARREQSAAIRAWAKARGLVVEERGRISAFVVAQYEAEHGGER